ncbi:MAG: ribosome biogenesis GTPase Der [Candidatus Polarisedimenticolia bacterium]
MQLPLVALVGAPNAGKSTLFNRLLGRRKALVHAQPGMTRDLNEEEASWDGRPVRLMDTGGLFPPGDAAMADLVRLQVMEAAGQADVIVLVVDGRAGLTPIDRELGRMMRTTGRPVVVAVNKMDVPGRDDPAAEFHALGFEDVVPISAEHGLAIADLIEAVSSRLQPEAEERTEAGASPEIRIAIGGRPNVGKSSLLNRLLDQERSIVSEVPGTTRDTVDSLLRRGAKTYRIFDTAGLRRRGRVLPGPEGLSAMTARRHMEAADVVLILVDATEGITQQDLHVAGVPVEAKRPLIVLLNKSDRVDAAGAGALKTTAEGRLRFAPHAPVLAISARTGDGVARILPLVDEVHAQACRRLTTGRLNAWLQRAVEAHRPPTLSGRDVKFYYAVQASTNPPQIVLFGNIDEPPHFSYSRYLENSLREAFGLSRTPILLKYRERPRQERRFGKSARKRRKPRV